MFVPFSTTLYMEIMKSKIARLINLLEESIHNGLSGAGPSNREAAIGMSTVQHSLVNFQEGFVFLDEKEIVSWLLLGSTVIERSRQAVASYCGFFIVFGDGFK